MLTDGELRIVDAESLKWAAEVLHDALFEHDSIRYDTESATFVMTLDRASDGGGTRWVRCRLTFRQVERADVRTEGSGTSSLIDLHYDSDTRTLQFCVGGPPCIALHVRDLDGEVTDTGEPVPAGAHRWESCCLVAALAAAGGLGLGVWGLGRLVR